jgi:hypothetical protein
MAQRRYTDKREAGLSCYPTYFFNPEARLTRQTREQTAKREASRKEGQPAVIPTNPWTFVCSRLSSVSRRPLWG